MFFQEAAFYNFRPSTYQFYALHIQKHICKDIQTKKPYIHKQIIHVHIQSTDIYKNELYSHIHQP